MSDDEVLVLAVSGAIAVPLWSLWCWRAIRIGPATGFARDP